MAEETWSQILSLCINPLGFLKMNQNENISRIMTLVLSHACSTLGGLWTLPSLVPSSWHHLTPPPQCAQQATGGQIHSEPWVLRWHGYLHIDFVFIASSPAMPTTRLYCIWDTGPALFRFVCFSLGTQCLLYFPLPHFILVCFSQCLYRDPTGRPRLVIPC